MSDVVRLCEGDARKKTEKRHLTLSMIMMMMISFMQYLYFCTLAPQLVVVVVLHLKSAAETPNRIAQTGERTLSKLADT